MAFDDATACDTVDGDNADASSVTIVTITVRFMYEDDFVDLESLIMFLTDDCILLRPLVIILRRLPDTIASRHSIFTNAIASLTSTRRVSTH